jgi:hypothetical protein
VTTSETEWSSEPDEAEAAMMGVTTVSGSSMEDVLP